MQAAAYRKKFHIEKYSSDWEEFYMKIAENACWDLLQMLVIHFLFILVLIL